MAWQRKGLIDVSVLAGLLVCLLAFRLRLIDLGRLNLWGDEAWALYAHHIGLARLTVETGRDIHPPLYYYTVLAWVRLAGTDEFALRYLSVFAGTLLIATVFTLGRRLAGVRVGMLSALLTAITPFAVYYSQEARPFIWVMLWCTLALYVLVRSLDGSRQNWIGYAAFTFLAAFTSYPTALWFALHGLLILARPAWRRHFWTWLGIEAGILALALPWLLVFGRDIQAHLAGQGAFTAREAMSLPALLFRSLGGFLAGITLPPIGTWLVSIVALALGVFGIAVSRRQSWDAVAILSVLALLPVLALYPIHRRFPWFEPRVLAFCAVPLYLLIAIGLDGWLSRRWWLFAVGGAVLIAAWGCGLYDYWGRFDRYSPELEDYYPLIAHIEAQAQPGDLVLYNANWHVGYFYAYYRGARLDFQPFLEAQSVSGPRQVWVVLRDVVRQPGGSRPEDQVEDLISAAAFKVDEQWFGHIRVTRYDVPPPGIPVAHPVGAMLGDITLNEFTVQPDLRDGTWTVPPGQAIYLTLTWQTGNLLDRGYQVFTHIIGPYNPRTGGPVWAQHDGVPGNQERPTTGWAVGVPVADRHVLWVDAAAPPGDGYLLEVGMYDPETGVRLQVVLPDGTVSDRLILAGVSVGAP